MMEELRFAIRCHGSTKKPRLRRRCSQCAAAHHPAGSAGHGLDSNSGAVVPAAVCSDRSSPNGLLVFQSTSSGGGGLQPAMADDVIHRRRTNLSRDQRDVNSDGYYASTNSRYSTTASCGDVTVVTDQRSDVTNEYYRDVTNERFRNFAADPVYNTGKI